MDLDGFVYNPVHCSKVDKTTCEDVQSAWDKVCLPCETAYDWQRTYPWIEGTLAAGESVRPVDPANVVQLAIATADGEGTLDAYFIASHGADPDLKDTTIIYNHGNYAGIEHYQPRVRLLHEAGYNVLVWDYRGYGKSKPDTAPTGKQFIEDARLVRAETAKHAPDAKRVIAYGYSLGAIPAVEMAVHDEGVDPVCALVLEAGFTSLSSIAEANGAVSLPETFLSNGWFDNHDKLKGFKQPFFAMYGDKDSRFSVAQAEALVGEASGPRELWILPGVKHGIADIGIPEAGFTAYRDRLKAFLSKRAASCIK